MSCKRSLLLRCGLHDQRLDYSIDVELAWRLRPTGLRVVYDASAVSLMARPIDVDAFGERSEAKGRAHATVAALHPGTEIASRLVPAGAAELWAREAAGGRAAAAPDRGAGGAAAAGDDGVLPELHAAYRELFRILHAKGVATATDADRTGSARPSPRAATPTPVDGPEPALVHDGSPEDAGRPPAAQRHDPGVEPHARAGRHGPPDHRARVGGGPGADRGRGRRQRLARRGAPPRPGLPLPREPGRVGRLEHRDPPLVGPRGGGAQQRLPGRAGLGRGAARCRDRRPPHRVPVHRPLRRPRVHPARPGRDRRVVLRADQGSSTTRSGPSTSGSARPSARTPTTGTGPGSWASSCHRFRPPGWCTPAARAARPGRTCCCRPTATSTAGSTASTPTGPRPTTTGRSSTTRPKPKWMRVRSGARPAEGVLHRAEQDRHVVVPRGDGDPGAEQPPLGRARRSRPARSRRRWTRADPCCRASTQRSTPSPTSGC